MSDKKTLVSWSRGCLISTFLCVFIGLFGKLYLFYSIALVFLILSVVIFYFARKKREEK